MTLIVALKCDNGVILGADSCLTGTIAGREVAMEISSSKIEDLGADKLMGFSYSDDALYEQLRKCLAQYANQTLEQMNNSATLKQQLQQLSGAHRGYAGVLIVENRYSAPILEIGVNERGLGDVLIKPYRVQNSCFAIGSETKRVTGCKIDEKDIKLAALQVFNKIDEIIQTGGRAKGIDHPTSIGLKNREKYIVSASTKEELAQKIGLASPKPAVASQSAVETKKQMAINSSFEKALNEPGASFAHPRKTKLLLEDFFVFPNLRNLKEEKDQGRGSANHIESSSTLCDIKPPTNRILLMGDEKSGRTSLCRILFKSYYHKGFVPVYIDAYDVKETTLAGFNKLVTKQYKKQYSADTLEEFNKLENSRKWLIIDNFNKSPLNIKYRTLLLSRLNESYPNIIITANDLFQIEEIVYEKEQKDAFKNYQQYEIMRFGHYLRHELINKWNKLGQEAIITQSDLTLKNTKCEQVVNTIIGASFIPAYPFFLLTILQTIEAATPFNLRDTSYSYYYSYLITQALGRAHIIPDELDVYHNYITELAYFFFKNRKREIEHEEMNGFHTQFCEKYRIELSQDTVVKRLLAASVLEENGNSFKFKYKYIYYFFMAKHLSDNIADKGTKQIISAMCKRLHQEEFANVIVFLIHHSKDPFIIDEITTNAQAVFSEVAPVRFDDDIKNVSALADKMQKLVLESKNTDAVREENLKAQDEIEGAIEQSHEDAVLGEDDLQEDIGN